MKPLMCLQNVFDEYEHFFPLNVVLGKSLKNISPNSSMSYTETLNLHSDSLSILTNGNMDDSLETIEFDDIISSFDILEVEQKRKIEVILNRQNDLKIIMTGIEELKDLDVNNTEHYKRINIKPSLEDENYKVFGSVISRNNLRLRDILISFELYDFNGFYAMIRTLNNTDIDIRECFILWMIIGNPSKLSVFSPRNRELQVYCFKGLITLQHNNSCYPIKTPCQLSEGYTISINIYRSTTNYKSVINVIGWSQNYIYFQIVESNYNSSNFESSNGLNVISKSHDQYNCDTYFLVNIEVNICILSSHYENLNIDNRELKKYSLNSIGHILTKNTEVIPFTKYLQEMAADIATDTKDTIGITTNVKDIGDEIKASLENLKRFDLRLKLRVSLDIARGLNFLRTVEIMHRDIRAKNVLITINETAKLTNIRSSRDHLLLNKSQMPEEFKQLQFEAVHQDPDFRPKITKMFEVLKNCVRLSQDTSSSNSSSLSKNSSTLKFPSKRASNIYQAPPINLPDFESFKYMTLADAAKQHKMYKNGLVEGPPNKDKIVAEVYKEVADDEANEYPEAKLRYGDFLFHGKGIEKNKSEALKYFEKAAEDGFRVALYNVGKMYYDGIGCTKDIEKAKYYMELAAYNCYGYAIAFRNEHNL
ncbi:unnamed protein product [Rhizophagus irregularis]|nr:unnamed protein product [Rhizophagus irregularis]